MMMMDKFGMDLLCVVVAISFLMVLVDDWLMMWAIGSNSSSQLTIYLGYRREGQWSDKTNWEFKLTEVKQTFRGLKKMES